MQIDPTYQFTSNCFSNIKLRQHNTNRILQQSQRMFYTKFQTSVIQRKSQQIIFEVKQNLQLIQNLNNNLIDDLNNLGLNYISSGFTSIQNYVNYLISFLCKTANRLSETCEMALSSKLESKISDRNICEICFKKIEQIRIKNIETKISQNSYKFQKLQQLSRDEIKQIYKSEEIIQHELDDNKVLTQAVLSEFFLKKQLLLSLNNDKTIKILEEFLKTLSIEADKKYNIPNIIQKSYIIDYKNGKQIVNKLYHDLTLHIIQITRKDMIPIFQKATLSYNQKQKQYYRSKLKHSQTQTDINLKHNMRRNGQIFEMNDHHKKGKYLDDLINQNWQYKKQIQKLSKQKKKIEKNPINKPQKNPINLSNSQLEPQLKNQKSKFQNLYSNEHQKSIQDQRKIVQEYQNKIEQLEQQIISNYKQKCHKSIQVEIKGIDKTCQTYYMKISETTHKQIDQQQQNNQQNKQKLSKHKKINEQIQNNIIEKLDEETKNQRKIVTKRFFQHKKHYSKLRPSIVNHLNSNLNSKLNKNEQNKQKKDKKNKKKEDNKENSANLQATQINLKTQLFIIPKNHDIAVQTQQNKILQLDQLHLESYQNYRTQINTMTNMIKKQIQKKQFIHPINHFKEIKENIANSLNQKGYYAVKQNNNFLNKIRQNTEVTSNTKILDRIQQDVYQHKHQKIQQNDVKQLLEYLQKNQIHLKDMKIFKLLKKTIQQKKSESKSKPKTKTKVKEFEFPENIEKKKQGIHLQKNKIKKYNKRNFFLKTETQQVDLSINKQILNHNQNKYILENRQTQQNFMNENNKIKQIATDKQFLKNQANNQCDRQLSLLNQVNGHKIEFNTDDLMLFGGLSQSYKFEINNKKNSLKKKKYINQNKDQSLTTSQSQLIKQLFLHIENMKNNQREKYNNIKAFFKFPYQTAINKFNILDTSESLSENIFRNAFVYILTKHKNCEDKQICHHIIKFINKIEFSPKQQQEKKCELIFPKLC